jgi:hypothetical protein
MEPKEKAKFLIETFYQNAPDTFGTGKSFSHGQSCAKICVDEIISSIKNDQPDDPEFQEMIEEYWEQVKAEIEKL